MGSLDNDKIQRVLDMYSKLINGEMVNKSQEAKYYKVNEKSIQRDIDDIRVYFERQLEHTGIVNTVVYDRIDKGYKLEQNYKLNLSNSEILAICKILLESRSLTKNEMKELLHKIINCCVSDDNKKFITDMISNEEYHYIEPQHGTIYIDKMWEIAHAIHENKYIEIEYQRIKGKAVVKRKLKPLAIMFSEYYFYLIAFINDKELEEYFDLINDSCPTIYRIDRIKGLKTLDERYHIPYRDRFEEGEFRKRIQFMFGGKLQRIKFKYKGEAIEAVLDRLPTAKVLDEDEEGFIIEAEVYGNGIEIWLRSQGDTVEVFS